VLSRASPEAGWRPASWPNHRGATGRPKCPDHLHAAVTALGHARGFVGQSTARASRSASEGSDLT
jgi:hypothetical protein